VGDAILKLAALIFRQSIPPTALFGSDCELPDTRKLRSDVPPRIARPRFNVGEGAKNPAADEALSTTWERHSKSLSTLFLINLFCILFAFPLSAKK
jgi:hypothetical protein